MHHLIDAILAPIDIVYRLYKRIRDREYINNNCAEIYRLEAEKMLERDRMFGRPIFGSDLSKMLMYENPDSLRNIQRFRKRSRNI